MAKRTASGRKQARKSAKQRLRNRKTKQVLKGALKGIRTATKKEDILKQLPKVQSLIDKAARKHLVHRNTANRLKSRLVREAAEAK